MPSLGHPLGAGGAGMAGYWVGDGVSSVGGHTNFSGLPLPRQGGVGGRGSHQLDCGFPFWPPMAFANLTTLESMRPAPS